MTGFVLRIFADVHVPKTIVIALRDQGFEVRWALETDPTTTDADIQQQASVEGYIVLTEDRDFGELVVRQQLPSNGLVLFELHELSLGGKTTRIVEVISARGMALEGNVTVIEAGRVRTRKIVPSQ